MKRLVMPERLGEAPCQQDGRLERPGGDDLALQVVLDLQSELRH